MSLNMENGVAVWLLGRSVGRFRIILTLVALCLHLATHWGWHLWFSFLWNVSTAIWLTGLEFATHIHVPPGWVAVTLVTLWQIGREPELHFKWSPGHKNGMYSHKSHLSGPINETTWLADIFTDSAMAFVGEGRDMCHITAIFGVTEVSIQCALIGRSLS